MIAFAIACLLVATGLVALLSATDSMVRGWRSYCALASELRALKTPCVQGSAVASRKMNTRQSRPARANGLRRRTVMSAGLRAAA